MHNRKILSTLFCNLKSCFKLHIYKKQKEKKVSKNEKNYDIFQLENGTGNTAFPEMNNLFSDMIDFYFYEGVWSN